MENVTTVQFFFLSGLQKTWMNKSLFFPLTLITYLIIITVNLTVIISIIKEKKLHQPMYIFLCNLCFNSLYGTIGFYPKFLSDLLSGVQMISYGGCLTQLYVIYTSVLCEITILTVMAFDRYVAICKPLQYHSIVSSLTVMKLLIFSWFYPLSTSVIVLGLTIRLPLCGSDIQKLFCDNTSVLKHSCVPITLNTIWSFCLIFGQILQVIFIACSYCQIIRACLKSKEGRIKFTQTCVPHLLTMVIFIIVTLFDVGYGWFGNMNNALNLRNAMAIQFLVIPPVFNPIIYGLNLQQVRMAIFKRKYKHHTMGTGLSFTKTFYRR